MDARKLERQMALCASYELSLANPVPVSLGRWEALWLEYAVAEDGGAAPDETCLVVDAYLVDAEGEYLCVPVEREVSVPRGSLAIAPDAGMPYREYLSWLASVAGDGRTGLAEALAHGGNEGYAPLYEAALSASAAALEEGA